jgi:hypothetical protein
MHHTLRAAAPLVRQKQAKLGSSKKQIAALLPPATHLAAAAAAVEQQQVKQPAASHHLHTHHCCMSSTNGWNHQQQCSIAIAQERLLYVEPNWHHATSPPEQFKHPAAQLNDLAPSLLHVLHKLSRHFKQQRHANKVGSANPNAAACLDIQLHSTYTATNPPKHQEP